MLPAREAPASTLPPILGSWPASQPHQCTQPQAIFDLLQRGIDFVQRAPVTLKALNHFETELCRLLGVHDPAGKVRAIDALASLYGTIPASRQAALKFANPNVSR